jgi:hypothetical protein
VTRLVRTAIVALVATVAVAALFCSTMLVLVGRWAIIPTWLLGSAPTAGVGGIT